MSDEPTTAKVIPFPRISAWCRPRSSTRYSAAHIGGL